MTPWSPSDEAGSSSRHVRRSPRRARRSRRARRFVVGDSSAELGREGRAIVWRDVASRSTSTITSTPWRRQRRSGIGSAVADAVHLASAARARLGRQPWSAVTTGCAAGGARSRARRRALGNDRRLEVVARRVGEQSRDTLEPDAVRDQPLPRIGAAREEGERRADVARRVVERAAERQLLVVQPVRVDAQLGAALASAEEDDRAARTDELEGVAATRPRCPPPRSRRRRPRRRPSRRRRAARARAAPGARRRPPGRPPASATQAREHQPDRAGAEDRDPVCRPRPPRARRRAGSRRAARPSPRPRARARAGRGGGSRARSAPARAGTRRRRRSGARAARRARRLPPSSPRRRGGRRRRCRRTRARTGSAARRAAAGARAGTSSGRCRR